MVRPQVYSHTAILTDMRPVTSTGHGDGRQHGDGTGYGRVAGVDGVGPRWVAAVLEDGTAEVSWQLGDADEVLALVDSCDRVGLDVPVGFAVTGRRVADVEAATRLGVARSSIFPTAPAAAFAVARRLGTAREVRSTAQEASLGAGGAGISTQSWGLVPKVLAVEDALRAHGPAGDRCVEVHPETSFRAMAIELGELQVPAGKRSAAGMVWRLRLLGRALELDVVGCLADPALVAVPVDDALDALAAAWTARRARAGTASVLGQTNDAVWSDGTPAPGRAVIHV